jgi:hypothetical protein
VTEADYWRELEFRISRDLARMTDNTLRFLWCDGFIPEGYLLEDPTPRILGRAWICNGSRQDRWEFILFVDRATRVRENISWSALLPPEDATGWFALDVDSRRIELNPFATTAA